jgi:hypothetical protein
MPLPRRTVLTGDPGLTKYYVFDREPKDSRRRVEVSSRQTDRCRTLTRFAFHTHREGLGRSCSMARNRSRILTAGLMALAGVSLVFFGTVAASSSLSQMNLDTPYTGPVAPQYSPPDLEGTTTAFSTLWPTTSEGDDVQTGVGPWSYWWHVGDYAIGNRSTTLTSVSRLDYHMVITENALNNGGHCDIDFYLNGVNIGSFQVLEGEFEKNLSFSFDPIAGPDFELYMEETNLVDPGLGSFLLDSDYPGDVTLSQAWDHCFMDENYTPELQLNIEGTVIRGQAVLPDTPGFPAPLTGTFRDGWAFFSIAYRDDTGLRFYKVQISNGMGTTWGITDDTSDYYDNPHPAHIVPCGAATGTLGTGTVAK